METKTIIIALIAVAALGGVWYLFTTNSLVGLGVGAPVATTTPPTATTSAAPQPSSASPAPARTTPKPVASAKVTGIGPLSYLFGLKQSLVCSVKTLSGYKRSGTMYVADGKMRANFTTSSMIDDGTYLYVWTNGDSKGLKLLASASASGSAIATNGGFDLAYDLSYSCNMWAENVSIFSPPSSVSFSNSF
jgi:hypothetical protein